VLEGSSQVTERTGAEFRCGEERRCVCSLSSERRNEEWGTVTLAEGREETRRGVEETQRRTPRKGKKKGDLRKVKPNSFFGQLVGDLGCRKQKTSSYDLEKGQ